MVQTLKKDRGDSLVMVALSLFVLLALLALAIDVGFAYSERRRMQNAADAGALAGAAVMMTGGSDTQIRAAVDEYTRLNTAQTFEAFYTVNNSRVGAVGGGSVPRDATGIEVVAVVDFPTFLAFLVGTNEIEAHGDSIGGYSPLDIAVVLDRSGSMDDDSCSWTHLYPTYPPPGGRNCNDPLNQSNCIACYTCIPGRNCSRPSGQTHGVWTPPPQPITDAKAAAISFVDMNNPNLTHLALVSYADSSSTNPHLTDNFGSVRTAINALVADGCTDIPGGLRSARNELTSSRSRPDAMDFIVFLTDGLPNMAYGTNYCCPDTCSTPQNRTRDEANSAASQNIVIYTIALGENADRQLMQDVANITGGESFYAPTSADLMAIYRTIFERIQLRLTM